MFIDVQGFGALYGNEAADSLWGLADLMEGVFRIARDAPRLGISRIFAHHIGDAFVLIDDGGRIYVNWIDSATPAITAAKEILRIRGYDARKLRDLFDAATKRNASPPEWSERTARFLRAPNGASASP